MLFHPLNTHIALPEQMNDPFCYKPHPLSVEAARQVIAYLEDCELQTEVAQGKMLGVLVCQNKKGETGFLAAYSGQLAGREDWPWFVPAVYDYLQPTGYFKQEEQFITDINRRIAELDASKNIGQLRQVLRQTQHEAATQLEAYRQLMDQAKRRRDELRAAGQDQDALIRESQFQKAELRRMKKYWAKQVAAAEAQLKPLEEVLTALRQERHRRSDALQRWLFDQFQMLNGKGLQRTLTDIFAPTPQHVPPAGSGECCAPKLLQYAFSNHLTPLCIAEFWYGQSPKMEVRHHGQYYPACRGKCKPILEWMLSSTEVKQADRPNLKGLHALCEIYADESLVVIEKPAGLLSVPGKTGEESVESILQSRYPKVYMVHRLDQDTSGLMVVALTQRAYHLLQRQFEQHNVTKRYTALLDGHAEGSGTIRLPLRPDPLDRPRQVVDTEHGKEAVTDYQVLGTEQGYTRIDLWPHTGRTHQLRMHCAHRQGLGAPIVGDRLYGRPSHRLCLHAALLSFDHPVTGERMVFEKETDWI